MQVPAAPAARVKSSTAAWSQSMPPMQRKLACMLPTPRLPAVESLGAAAQATEQVHVSDFDVLHYTVTSAVPQGRATPVKSGRVLGLSGLGTRPSSRRQFRHL